MGSVPSHSQPFPPALICRLAHVRLPLLWLLSSHSSRNGWDHHSSRCLRWTDLCWTHGNVAWSFLWGRCPFPFCPSPRAKWLATQIQLVEVKKQELRLCNPAIKLAGWLSNLDFYYIIGVFCIFGKSGVKSAFFLFASFSLFSLFCSQVVAWSYWFIISVLAVPSFHGLKSYQRGNGRIFLFSFRSVGQLYV